MFNSKLLEDAEIKLKNNSNTPTQSSDLGQENSGHHLVDKKSLV